MESHIWQQIPSIRCEASSKKGVFKLIAKTPFGIECRIAKAWSSTAHKRLLYAKCMTSSSQERFDHNIDLFYQWSKMNNGLRLKRKVFGGLALEGSILLEFSCGSDFNSKQINANRLKSVVSCDFDPTAIHIAKTKNQSANINLVLADIRTQMSEGQYEDIVWDVGIRHFTLEEIASIISNIKQRLTANCILSGYTVLERANGVVDEHHEREFKDIADLKKFLSPYFKNVKVFETIYPSRHHLYFWASDDIILFDGNSAHRT
jgi:hypothetical protein